ncbi:MAG: hypothetical protein O3B04_02985 [Chloroflexi bacterium]|nr:hypothetical protein [Chloroflexota bacterium]
MVMARLFGKRPQTRTDWSAMASIISAEQKLMARGEISPSRRGGLIYRNDESVPFLRNLKQELDPVLYSGPGATKTAFEIQDDEQGMRWIVMEDGDFSDLVSSVYTVGNAMGANGAASNLLAAVFELYFTGAVDDNSFRSGLRTYWIYRYDRQSFYPFVPTGDATGERDKPTEVSLASRARRQGMVIERNMEEWMGLWGIPF